MTQEPLPFSRITLTDRVACLFRSRPGQWIDWRDIAQVGGGMGWRTRISNLRYPPYSLDIENRTYRKAGYTLSEYRLREAGQRVA